MTKKTVLVADDQLLFMRDVIAQLKEVYTVETVTCGDEAIERIHKGGLDLLILDNSMPPGPEGNCIARHVRKQYSNIPIVLQSGEYKKYLNLESIGVKVMNKHDEVGIAAYVKQILGDGRIRKNAFGKELYDIQEILQKPVEEYIQNTLESVLSCIGIRDPAQQTKSIFEHARKYDSLEEYEHAAHEILMACDAVTRIPQSLQERASRVYRQIRNYVGGKYVLDLGCGDGAIAALLAKQEIPSVHVVLADVTVDTALTKFYQTPRGIDLQNVTVCVDFSILDDRAKYVPFYLLDPKKKSLFNSKVFDETLLLTVLHHCDDPIQTLQEAQRVTKHGGQIIIIESVYGIQDETAYGRLTAEEQFQANIFFDHFYNRVLHYSKDPQTKVNVPFNFNTPEGWKREFERLCLKQKEVVHLGIDQPTVPEYHTLHILEV